MGRAGGLKYPTRSPHIFPSTLRFPKIKDDWGWKEMKYKATCSTDIHDYFEGTPRKQSLKDINSRVLIGQYPELGAHGLFTPSRHWPKRAQSCKVKSARSKNMGQIFSPFQNNIQVRSRGGGGLQIHILLLFAILQSSI